MWLYTKHCCCVDVALHAELHDSNTKLEDAAQEVFHQLISKPNQGDCRWVNFSPTSRGNNAFQHFWNVILQPWQCFTQYNTDYKSMFHVRWVHSELLSTMWHPFSYKRQVNPAACSHSFTYHSAVLMGRQQLGYTGSLQPSIYLPFSCFNGETAAFVHWQLAAIHLPTIQLF